MDSTSGSVVAKETTTDTAVLSVTREGITASQYGAVGGSGSLAISTQ